MRQSAHCKVSTKKSSHDQTKSKYSSIIKCPPNTLLFPQLKNLNVRFNQSLEPSIVPKKSRHVLQQRSFTKSPQK